MPEPGNPPTHVLLKFTYPQGSGSVGLSQRQSRHVGHQLIDAADAELRGDPFEIELRGPGRYVGSPGLDEEQALSALEQTLGLIERAGLRVLCDQDGSPVRLVLDRVSIERKQ